MNIGHLHECAQQFELQVVESGFKRDLDDYLASLPNMQSNIVTLRETASVIAATLDRIWASDLPDAMLALLPARNPGPFTASDHRDQLHALIADKQIELREFFRLFQERLTALRTQVIANHAAVQEILAFLRPYVSVGERQMASEQFAVAAIVLNERTTITNLKSFERTLKIWNRTLPLYHRLLKSQSPADVELVEVQNGSIDLIVNLDIKVAINLAEIFKIGFEVFAGYVAYKKLVLPITATYRGNRELLAGEKDREKQLLDNIGHAVKIAIEAQHKAALKTDRAIEKTSVAKKVQEVAGLVTSHIVHGNDFRLLALPPSDDEDVSAEEAKQFRQQLAEKSLAARRALSELPDADKIKLIEMYHPNDPEDGDGKK